MAPLTIALFNIFQKQIKDVDVYIITFYIALANDIFFSLISMGSDYSFLHRFDMSDWALLILSGILLAFQIMLQAKALSHDNVNRVALYSYLSPVFQLGFDLFIIHSQFVGIQILGCCFIVVANMLMLGHSINKRRGY